MAFAVDHYFWQVAEIIVFILEWVFLGVLLQNLSDLAAATSYHETKYSNISLMERHLPFMTNDLTRSVSLIPA